MAIHDHEFSTRPETFTELRWRIQYISELGVGRLMRRQYQSEDEAFQEAMRKIS
jgi:hypothetical protein